MHDLKANVFLRYVYIDRIDESLISNNVDVPGLAPHTSDLIANAKIPI